MKKNKVDSTKINLSYDDSAFGYTLTLLPHNCRTELINFCNEYLKIFNIIFDNYNAYYSPITKTELDKLYLKSIVMQDLFNRFVNPFVAIYNKQKQFRKLVFVDSIIEMLKIEDEDKDKTKLIFCKELNSKLIRKALAPHMAAVSGLTREIKRRSQGTKSASLPLYYAIVDCSEEEKPTLKLNKTLRMVFKSKSKYEKIFGSHFNDAINEQRKKFYNYLDKVSDNNTNKGDEQLISFLYGNYSERENARGLNIDDKKEKKEGNMPGNFKDSFHKYYERNYSNQNKKQILKSILNAYRKNNPK